MSVSQLVTFIQDHSAQYQTFISLTHLTEKGSERLFLLKTIPLHLTPKSLTQNPKFTISKL